MNSPGYNTPYGLRPYGRQEHSQYPPRPRPVEDTLLQREVTIERKTFILSLKQNPRGRFLRVLESTASRSKYPSIIVPKEGLKEFQRMVADMVKANEEIPETGNPPQQ